jgi:O-antigen ligase
MVLPSLINFNLKSETTAKWAMVVLFFSLSTSRSLFAMSAFVMILGWFFSGQWRQKLNTLIEKPAALWITALVAWMYLSILWSEGTPDSIAYAAKVQWQLLLIPIIVTLANDDAWIDKSWKAFAIGMTVLILHIYLMQVVEIPWVHSDSPDRVFFNPIPQSIALSIFSAWCILEMIRRSGYKLYKISLIFLLLAATYAVFAISQQRSGYVAWLTACSTVLIFSLGSRQRLMAIFTILFLFVAIVMSSSKIQGRIEQAKMDIASYEYKNNYSSIGSRLHMWFTGAQLIKEAPMLGHGLGSYPVVSAEKFKDPAMCAIACVHPHNQYIFYAIEFGSIGFLLFLSFFVSFFIRSSSNTSSRITSNAILLVIIIVGLFDITLWYRGFIYMFVPLLALNISSN